MATYINAIYTNVFKDVLQVVNKTDDLKNNNAELIVIEFSSDWSKYEKTAILGINDKLVSIPQVEWVNNVIQIPNLILKEKGILQLKIVGVLESKTRQINFVNISINK